MTSTKKIALTALPIFDVILLPFVYPAAWLLKGIRRAGVHRLPFCRAALLKAGVFPVRSHYYEPQFEFANLRRPLSQDRPLLGVDWNAAGQLELLELLTFASELADLPVEMVDDVTFRLNNYSFSSGDAEYWYQIIRLKKPRRIFEIGSGHSTLMAVKAVRKNEEEDPAYQCEHVCIEPYEMQWLEKIGISIVRQKVEDVDVNFFSTLEENDILFIDSSHMIRPEGDVLFEYLELLPTLKPGVIVHVHDIFSPRNYPQEWLRDEVRFWNEQYLLEAFLTHNRDWKIIGALNYLTHGHFDKMKKVAPTISVGTEPGSFYMQRVE